MKKIPLEDLKPGMRFDKPLYIDKNNMFVGANVNIKEIDLKRLQKWGINEVETAGRLMSSSEEMKFHVMMTDEAAAAAAQPAPVSGEAGKIIEDYNNLLKKRTSLIKVHRDACTVVGDIYGAIKNDEKFQTDDLEFALENIINILSEANSIFLFLYGLDEGKNYLMYHSVNVTFYALLIGIGLKYTPVKLRELGLGTLLIDAGMNKIPVYITHKQSNLTDQEFNQVKTHPLLGFRALRDLGRVKERAALVCLQHHENYDGSGYPRGLKGNMIDEYSRIASIADSYEAQLVNRSYRKKQLFYQAMKELLSGGINKFDPVLLQVFLSQMSVYPVGSMVQFNDGKIGVVIGSVSKKPLRPIVKLIFDEKHERIGDTRIINLLDDSSLFITKVLDETESGVSLLDIL